MNYMETINNIAVARFNKFIKPTSQCHLWIGQKDKDGYGTFYYFKKNRKAHRFAYYIINGDIPKGMFIDHSCRNRSCVNPQHLRCVTPRVNCLENSISLGAINAKKTHCKNGHTFDKTYGTKKKQRYCSICEREKSKRLQKKWRAEANKIMC